MKDDPRIAAARGGGDHPRLTAEQIAKGQRTARRYALGRGALRRALLAGKVDAVDLLIGELDDETFDEELDVTYGQLVEPMKSWNVVQWVPGIAETRGVMIFAIADVPASQALGELRPGQRQRLGQAVDLVTRRRDAEPRW